MPKIRIRYLSDKIEKLRYIDGKSDWIDLRAAETVELKAGESRYIPLGVAMVLPQGYEAHVLPRSSTFRNYGILMSNSMGVVDESYCGDEDEWKMPGLCHPRLPHRSERPHCPVPHHGASARYRI